jgi:TonB family protein
VTGDLTDNDASAFAQVTIRRNGSVAHSTLHRRSGNAVLDKSVERVLNDVRHIGAPFPEGTRDSERTFTIEFNLKTKRAVG